MEKLVVDNELFYFDNRKLYDESFIEYPKNVSNKILGDYYSKIDYSAYDEAKLLKLIKELKVAEHGVRLFLNISV